MLKSSLRLCRVIIIVYNAFDCKKYLLTTHNEYVISTDLYELLPTTDRIFFACWRDDTFVLLHHFVKKTQKTPPREIAQAQRNLRDFLERADQDEQKD